MFTIWGGCFSYRERGLLDTYGCLGGWDCTPRKLSARLSLVEEGLRAHGNVVAEVERAVEPEIEPVICRKLEGWLKMDDWTHHFKNF